MGLGKTRDSQTNLRGKAARQNNHHLLRRQRVVDPGLLENITGPVTTFRLGVELSVPETPVFLGMALSSAVVAGEVNRRSPFDFAPRDFLLRLLALAKSLRLSLKKAAYVDLVGSAK